MYYLCAIFQRKVIHQHIFECDIVISWNTRATVNNSAQSLGILPNFAELSPKISSGQKFLVQPTPSRWHENAERHQANKNWLRYSQSIAMKMLDKMEELHLSQTQLADKMGCSQQYISKVLRGQENLSIETIAKIESALSIQILC